MDDVFIALDKITKQLPKRKTYIRNVKKINYGDVILSPIKIPLNIPPNNQSSMDGIGVKNKGKSFIIKGKTYLNKIRKVVISKNECLIVKTGSLIPNEIKYVIPIERLIKNNNTYDVLNYNFKNKYIRTKGHIFKKNQKIKLKREFLSLKDLITIKSINKLNVKVQSKLRFKIIATGSEFTSKHFIHPTNSDYIEKTIIKYGQIVDENIHIIDNQKRIVQEINNSKSDITIIVGGTGKSEDDIKFNNYKLKINGLDLKPGRPFKFFSKSNKLYLFFPGNPCSSFVLTNILLKSIINKYCFDNDRLEKVTFDIKDIRYNFKKLVRKTFLFGNIKNKNLIILKNQESSNISNFLNSNCLVYYDRSKKIKIFKIND